MGLRSAEFETVQDLPRDLPLESAKREHEAMREGIRAGDSFGLTRAGPRGTRFRFGCSAVDAGVHGIHFGEVIGGEALGEGELWTETGCGGAAPLFACHAPIGNRNVRRGRMGAV